MSLKFLNSKENATLSGWPGSFRFGAAALFIVAVAVYVGTRYVDVSFMLVVAAIVGGYMALNIGANDVANNVGPAVGARALTLGGAILIAVVFEASGALIAGGDVVTTIKQGIIDPDLVPTSDEFVWLMLAAMLAGALWLNIATAVGAPISTTHSIVGGVLGAGVAAVGLDIANWPAVGAIVASWIISPVMGGIIAAVFLLLIKRTITYKQDKIAAAKTIVPLLVSLMTCAFATYLILKGFKNIWKAPFGQAILVGVVIAGAVYLIINRKIAKASRHLTNEKDSINRLFTVPLIFAAALLSFSHGANDVANAVGPLAAINDVLIRGGISTKAAIPLWVLAVGALGIAVGLALYGPKLIRTVGSEITDLDQMRAFSIAMASAITVIIASQLGLPVSSTHIAVGGVFGVGFLREYIKSSHARILFEIEHHHQGADRMIVEAFLHEYSNATLDAKAQLLSKLKKQSAAPLLSKKERKLLKKDYREALVKRTVLMKIVVAWIVTVPVSAVMAAGLYFMLRGIMVP